MGIKGLCNYRYYAFFKMITNRTHIMTTRSMARQQQIQAAQLPVGDQSMDGSSATNSTNRTVLISPARSVPRASYAETLSNQPPPTFSPVQMAVDGSLDFTWSIEDPSLASIFPIESPSAVQTVDMGGQSADSTLSADTTVLHGDTTVDFSPSNLFQSP